MFGKFNRALLGMALVGGTMSWSCWGSDEIATTPNSEHSGQQSYVAQSQKISTITNDYEIKQESKPLFQYKPSCLIDHDGLKNQLFTNSDARELCDELEKEFQDNNRDINDYTTALISLININCQNLIDSVRGLMTYNEWVTEDRHLAKLWMEVLIKLGGKLDSETEARINAYFNHQK
ncbi:MAG: hypothetical protein EOM76_09825 [Sphingobacteriia bacterium]|nr:hypothetical protein [Sphingobacteriia bacterium]